MRCLSIVLSVSLAAASAFAHACGDEAPVRPFEAEQQRFRLMLVDGRFDELESWATKSEQPGARISDGQSLHSAVLAGMRISQPCGAASMDAERMMAAEGYRSRLSEWVAHYPSSRTARLANATVPLTVAWAARGPGYASSVHDKGWEVFRDNVAKARASLEALPPDVRADPAWYAAMLEVLKLQSAPEAEYERMLAEATARHPDYEMIWFEAGSYYAPKWGGDAAKVRALAERAADATRAHLGETMYARVQWSSADRAMFRSGQADWPRMKAGFERMMQDYPDNWNANQFGRFACNAHDPDGLRKAFAHIEKPIADVWDIPYDTCKRHANDAAPPAQQVSR